MSKHKKTLMEKKLTDQNREMAYTFSPVSQSKPTISTPQAGTIYTHEYLKQDLLKTVILTTSLIIIQLLMLFMLKTHMLKLPMANF